MTISGGTFTITTGDDGVHADKTVTITDGTLNIPKCYEGIEGQTITISGGTIDIVSSDDGPRNAPAAQIRAASAAEGRTASAAAPTAALSPAAPSASTRAATVSTPTAT